ncbi:MAG: hypothetical protein ACRBCJ_00910 [Hyphomicrobiaceae bacterium]
MSQIWLLFIFKIVSLAGSIASTVGLVGIFAFKETLGAYTSHLIVGGFTAIAVGELAGYVLAKSMSDETDTGSKDS